MFKRKKRKKKKKNCRFKLISIVESRRKEEKEEKEGRKEERKGKGRLKKFTVHYVVTCRMFSSSFELLLKKDITYLARFRQENSRRTGL